MLYWNRLSLLLVLLLFGHFASAQVKIPEVQYLSDHDGLILSATQTWGELGRGEAAHAAGIKAMPLKVGSKVYAKGLGTHANSDILILLNGAYSAFDAEVGAQAGNGNSVVLQVMLDERKAFDSGLMREGDPAKPVHIPLAGATIMRLIVNDGGDGYFSDGAVWGEARLTPAANASARKNLELDAMKTVNVAPFAKVMTSDPTRMDGVHNDRIESFPAGELFFETEVAPDAKGGYIAPRVESVGSLGLEWIDRRRLNKVELRFADVKQAPPAQGAQLQYWVIKRPMSGTPGVSRWQGRWEPFKGEIRADGDRWVALIDWNDNPEMRNGTLKVRWILPAGVGEGARCNLSAWTISRWDVADLQLQLEKPLSGQVGTIEIYNGEMISDAKPVLSQSWKLDGPLALKVRYSKPMPWMTDRTVLRFKLPGAAFGVAVDDVLTSGCVYIKECGFFAAAQSAKVSLENYKQRIAGKKSILDEVRAMPDQTVAQANEKTHRPDADFGQTGLSLACENHKFIVARDGSIEFSNDPTVMAMRQYILWLKEACRFKPQFGDGSAKTESRVLEGDWMPIPVITVKDGDVTYRQRTFVAPYDNAPLPKDAPAWLNRKPLCMVDYQIENAQAKPAGVSLKLDFVTRQESATPAELKVVGDGVHVLKGGKLMAVVLMPAGNLADHVQDLKIESKGGQWSLRGTLPAGGRLACLVQIPAWDAKAEELPAFNDMAELLARTKAYWTKLMAPSMQIELPEPMLRNAIMASQVHCMMAARSDDGKTVAPWIGGMDYGPLESESHSIIRGMEFMGQDDFARRSFDYFIKLYNPEGFLTTGYTTMGTGWHLWTLGEYYGLTRDDEWLKQVAPKVSWACKWVMTEREKTKKLDPLGRKRPEYGLMPPGVMADWAPYQYYFFLNSFYYAGLKAAGEALAAIGDPHAGEFVASAKEHRAEIMRAYRWVQAQAPVLPLRDGTWVPEYPTHVYCPSPIGNFYAGEDNGRSWCYDVELGAHHLIPMGVMEPRCPEADWMMNHMEDVQFLSEGWFYYPAAQSRKDWFSLGGFAKVQPYYARTVEVYALQDEVKPFIRAYLNSWISLLNREDLSMWEHFINAAFNKTHETGYFLYQSRTMLLTERGQELWLAPFVTNNWLKDGLSVAVSNAPTSFGKVGYRITSHAKDGYLEAEIDPPTRQMPERLVLRLRHPEGKSIRRVLVNGQETSDFDTAKEIIRLQPAKTKITVRAEY